MSYQIAKLGLGGILDQGVAIVRNHFGLLLAIMTFVFIPFHLVTSLIQLGMMPPVPANPTMDDLAAIRAAQAANWPFFLVVTVLSWLVIIPLTNAAVIDAVARIYLGMNTTAIESMKRGLRKIGPLVFTSMLVSSQR